VNKFVAGVHIATTRIEHQINRRVFGDVVKHLGEADDIVTVDQGLRNP
jgi:hypothetical protein